MSRHRDHAEELKPSEGQGFTHQLSIRRNWEEVLDALHFMLLKKWYYVGIATNTKRGLFNKLAKQGMAIDRKRTQVPEELQSVLKLNMVNLENLKSKINQKQAKGGLDRDVWHFTTAWENFPEGTKIIEIYQPMAMSFLGKSNAMRRGFIILDGKCNTTDQNTVMLLMKKVFESKEYTEKILEEVARMKKEKGKIEEPVLKVKEPLKPQGRSPGTLLTELKETPGSITSVTDYEKGILMDYFAKLKSQDAFTHEHEIIETRLKQLFGDI